MLFIWQTLKKNPALNTTGSPLIHTHRADMNCYLHLTFLLRLNVLVCSYCGMTLAIKALRAAAWVSGAFLLEIEAPIGLERASGSLLT